MTHVAEMIGYLAAFLVFLTFYIRTMVPLRVVALCSNCAFIAYGYVDGLYPILMLHIVLLPLNAMRLYQMVQLSWQVREAAHGDLNMDWIKPFSVIVDTHAGETLFRRGEPAAHMFVIVAGQFRLEESGTEIGPGNVVGELSLLAPTHRRTATLQCLEPGKVFRMSLGQLEQLYFQNQKFGFQFLKLITARMSEKHETLERALAEREHEIGRLRNEVTDRSESSRTAKVG